MAFKNRIRLPFKITRPQFPEERVNFRKADGTVKTLSVVIRKQYEGETDYFPESWHERLKIALAHDTITYEGEKYVGNIAQDGDYTIEWPDFLDYPTGKASFKVQVTPFDETNSNCQTCEEATQLSLEDDTITGLYGAALQEGETYTADLAENDLICCFPAVFSITSYNADYIDSISIDPATGELTITLLTDLVSANSLLLATYRVTCPNGNYDEADVFADIEGSIEGCLAPTDLEVTENNPNDITFSWTEPFSDGEYYWEIYEGTGPVGFPLQSGLIDITTNVTVSGLDPGTQYYFRVRTNCYGPDSNFIDITETTPESGELCGSYRVEFDNGSGNPSSQRFVSYRDCNFDLQNVLVFNMSSVIICAQQTAPGSPVEINGGFGITITYLGLC